jgi:uncharacterized membrane protein YvlD (DUF360 family)
MKYLLRVFLFNTFSIWLVSQTLPALVITGGWQVVLFAGFVLSLLMLVVHPILKILFIPINILTFGFLSWFINVIVLYLLTVFVPEVRVREWTFPGAMYQGFSIPPIHLTYFVALIIVALSITFFTNFFHKISEI